MTLAEFRIKAGYINRSRRGEQGFWGFVLIIIALGFIGRMFIVWLEKRGRLPGIGLATLLFSLFWGALILYILRGLREAERENIIRHAGLERSPAVTWSMIQHYCLDSGFQIVQRSPTHLFARRSGSIDAWFFVNDDGTVHYCLKQSQTSRAAAGWDFGYVSRCNKRFVAAMTAPEGSATRSS
jgi:hypothetical protein